MNVHHLVELRFGRFREGCVKARARVVHEAIEAAAGPMPVQRVPQLLHEGVERRDLADIERQRRPDAAALSDLGDDLFGFLTIASIGDYDVRTGFREPNGCVTPATAAAARHDCAPLPCAHVPFLPSACAPPSATAV